MTQEKVVPFCHFEMSEAIEKSRLTLSVGARSFPADEMTRVVVCLMTEVGGLMTKMELSKGQRLQFVSFQDVAIPGIL